MKICSTCNDEKDIFLFVKNSNQCKSCRSEYMKKYAVTNKTILKDKKKKRYEDSKQIILVERKKYYLLNKEDVICGVRKYYSENNVRIRGQKKKYYEENKSDIKHKNNIYDKERRKTDLFYRLRKDVSKGVQRALRARNGSKAGQSVMRYLPYSIDELKHHIEQQFELWMNWDNRASFISEKYDPADESTWTWHIDHIIPQSKLPYSSMGDENFQKCWALENLRPLKSIDNLKKGSS